MDIVDRAVWEWVKAIYTSSETLSAALANYQAEHAEAQRPQLELIEATRTQLSDAEEEKARLVKAYASGVLSLDKIAKTKTDLDRRLSDLTQVLAELTAALPATTLTQDDLERIQRDAADLRHGVALADNNPEEQRRILEQLLFEGRLVNTDGRQWVEVECILGAERLSTDYPTNGCRDARR